MLGRNLRRLYDVASGAPASRDALGRLELRAEELAAQVRSIGQELAVLRAAVAALDAASASHLRLAKVQYDDIRPQVRSIGQELAALRATVAALDAASASHLRLAKVQYDDIRGLRERLRALRQTEAYAATFDNQEPLISVPIATYNASRLLVERAIASVRAQTYERWEVVIVGDGCTDDTADRIAALGDPRIRFLNLPFRSVYPERPTDRWLVSGTMPHNRAVELCLGEWLAPLDDDDEFLPRTPRDPARTRAGATSRVRVRRARAGHRDGRRADTLLVSARVRPHRDAGVAPPALPRLLRVRLFSWVVGEPVDWNVVRRMRDAGVVMAATEVVVGRYHPSGVKRHA